MSALIVLNGCCTVQLSKGFNALIDAADWPRISQRKWTLGGTERHRYGYRSIYQGLDAHPRYKTRLLHVEIMQPQDGAWVDHRNGDGRDNRRENMRLCDRTTNSRNQRRVRGRSRFKGICWHTKNRKWEAKIRVMGKRMFLGNFESEIDAARAYDKAAIEAFGEFACTNAELFPEDFETCTPCS